MKYCQYPVDPVLQSWIRYFWSYDADASAVTTLYIRSFADCYPRLIFQDISSFSPIKNAAGDTKTATADANGVVNITMSFYTF